MIRAIYPLFILTIVQMTTSIFASGTVIFLDVDGVLHPASKPGGDAKPGQVLFDQEALRGLKRICESCTPVAKIVLTSNWRKLETSKSQVDHVLRQASIDSGVYAATDMFKNRQTEICHYLRNYQPSHFVILDDMDLTQVPPHESKLWGKGAYRAIEQHVVRTDYRCGLSEKDVQQAITVLSDKAWEGESFDESEGE